MKLDDLIQLHNRQLNRTVAENPFLAQKLKANLREYRENPGFLRHLLLRKPLMVYGFLLILFTIINFILIGYLTKPANPTSFSQPPELTLTAFSSTYPGSISHAYKEVMNEIH